MNTHNDLDEMEEDEELFEEELSQHNHLQHQLHPPGPRSPQSITTQAAAAMAAAMAAQQLLASAAAICGLDLATLLAALAGQQAGLSGPPQTPEQLMTAAAFLSPSHPVPEDLTVNQQQQQPQPLLHQSQQQQQVAQALTPHQHAIVAAAVHQQQQQHQHHHHYHQPQPQQQQQQAQSQQQTQNHHHRHHHLLGGHHHHSSIQTQQQLLATKGYNPMRAESGAQTEILTPTHLRKAKLMFFYVRYPNSSTLKECFRDVKFNKNNTAQLVKWFSNFREFYYIQMEKFARDAVADDRIQCKENIKVGFDHELINQLNNHYNKNRHIDLPEVFRLVVEETLRHFFEAIHNKRDQEQSWKKAIYKLIARLDQEVPEVFKTDAFNEHLE